MHDVLLKVLRRAAPLLAALAAPLAAQASSQLALDKGCYNCHGANLRGEAPTIERLAAKMSKYKGDAAAEQKKVDKFMVGEAFEHVDVHERLTAESARALLHWLAEGAH